MIWLSSDARKHTHWADAPPLCRIWCDVANAIFGATGDEHRAVRAANAAVISERRRSGLLRAPTAWREDGWAPKRLRAAWSPVDALKRLPLRQAEKPACRQSPHRNAAAG